MARSRRIVTHGGDCVAVEHGAERHIIIAPRGSVPAGVLRGTGSPASDEELPEDTES